MYKAYKTNKYSLNNVAMLALFAAGLIIAYVIVANRSALKLSDPIILTHSGLAIQIPAGNGWQETGQWTYKNNKLSGYSSLYLWRSYTNIFNIP